jgi:hypothetical protein
MRFFLDFKLDYVYSTQSTAANSESNAAIHSGGGLPVLGGETVQYYGHNISHLAGSVTTQSIGFKYVMVI